MRSSVIPFDFVDKRTSAFFKPTSVCGWNLWLCLTLILPDCSPWGLAASYSYRAYSDVFFLDTAIGIWNTVTPLLITKADAASGFHSLKNTTFSPSCNGRRSWTLIFTHSFMSFVIFYGSRFSRWGCIRGYSTWYLRENDILTLDYSRTQLTIATVKMASSLPRRGMYPLPLFTRCPSYHLLSAYVA